MGRHANIYDAVAERVGYQGFIRPTQKGDTDEESESSRQRTPESTGSQKGRGRPVAPDEVLFRARKAPERYEEDDIYAADRHLRPDQTLPDSNLLKAIHVYTSDFYSTATVNKGTYDYQSMNETALIACGVLLEEACKEILGSNGDLVFTEADPDENQRARAAQENSHATGPEFRSSRTESRASRSSAKDKKSKRPRDSSDDSTDRVSLS